MKNFAKKLCIISLFGMLINGFGIAQITAIGGFEGDLPSYWTKGSEPAGATLEWATDQYHSLGRSLKISKSATSESAAWISENVCDFWSPQHYADVDIKLGAFVKTEGVNINPSTDDEKWSISYTFYDSAGALIGETLLPIDQSAASSSGFVADTNAVGETILPVDSWTTIISFVGGKDATGTVWVDDFIFLGRGGAWAGEAWNNSVAYPTGWRDWLPPNGGKDGQYSHGFENTLVTDAEAHSGLRSLLFDLPADREPHDGWVGTLRFLFGAGAARSGSRDISMLTDVSAGDVLRLSVWMKASNLVPDSAAAYPVTWAVGFTYGFWDGNDNNDGWNSISGYPVDMQFVLPSVTSFDWTQYNLDVVVPDDPEARAFSIRLHPYSRFTGTVYFDDVTVEIIGSPVSVDEGTLSGIPMTYELSNNYPNPFNPTTTIGYAIPGQGVVSIDVYDILGQRIKTLVHKSMPAGYYEVNWDGRDQYGRVVSSGIYFYTLNTGSSMIVKRMLLIK
ncbi:MAG: T9SS type A sorting domain-containing protein [Candidatus Marinimicrobia bacterium]|nr:T9SS type A sorting domain-containing protein [Candidatus Neomarinimicrobiota bacterium]